MPTVFVLYPDLTVYSVYNGYWFWGRPSLSDLWGTLREVAREIRPDWRRSDAMSANPCWLALLSRRPDGALASAAASCLDTGFQGWLAVWATESRPHPDACRMDPAAVDVQGPAAAVSLVWPAASRRPLFDDPSVVQAIRRVAWVPHLRAVTTLTGTRSISLDPCSPHSRRSWRLGLDGGLWTLSGGSLAGEDFSLTQGCSPIA
ncbi:MAG: hypothetical protein WKF73_22280 [Nocardioidaceae bacterium]